MSETVELITSDNHELGGYVARPVGEVKGALVVVQEIFGVNAHIRSVTDSYAKEGYLSIAPAMFDRYERNFEVGYDEEGWRRAREITAKINFDFALEDVQAAIDWLQSETDKPIGIVGFCFGGTVAWLAACRLPDISAAVGYYGAAIPKFVDEKPRCEVMLHFGDNDEHIDKAGVKKIESTHPEVPLFHYEAGHAFNRDADPKAFVSTAAREARQRTLRFFQQHLVF
jgi:carboxymethylenebutenolidase